MYWGPVTTDRCLQIVVGALLDRLALLAPRAARLRVASERNLDDDVLTLVEEGRIAEPWRHVDLGRRCESDRTLQGDFRP